MSLQNDLEQALVDALRADPELAAVKTWETSIRDCLYASDKLTAGFRPEELPAVNVSAQEKPSKSSMWSSSEVAWDVPVTVVVITRHQRGRTALAEANLYGNAVSQVLHRCRKSDNPLGANRFVTGDVTGNSSSVEQKPVSFGLCTIDSTVKAVVEL